MKLWALSGLAGLAAMGLALDWYKGKTAGAPCLWLGLGLALAFWLLVALAGRATAGRGAALVWGSLAGSVAARVFLALLSPFGGLTWMLAAPFHHDAIMLCFVLASVLLLLGGPLAGRWPRLAAKRAAWPGPGPMLLLLALFLAGVFLLALGITAGGGEAAGAGGIKALLKNPKLLLATLALAGLALALAAARYPALALEVILPSVGFALVWAGWCYRALSQMGPLLDIWGPEALQALLLAAFFWAGAGLARQSPRSTT